MELISGKNLNEIAVQQAAAEGSSVYINPSYDITVAIMGAALVTMSNAMNTNRRADKTIQI